MAWLPAAAKLVVNVAVPPVPTATVPRTAFPSLNVTVPVGVPTPGAKTATGAVKGTAWPGTAGVTDDPPFAFGAARSTLTPPAPEALPANPIAAQNAAASAPGPMPRAPAPAA